MSDFFSSSTYFSLVLTLSSFAAARALQIKCKNSLLNPILLAAIISGLVISVLGIRVDDYQKGCQPLQYLLTPATICYAISLYEQIGKLKKDLPAILAGVASGTLCSLIGIRFLCKMLAFDQVMTISLLPKSITTAIGMVLSEEAGGIAAVSTAAIVITGVIGNMVGPLLCKCFHLKNEIAQGVAFGTASHAIGTSKAMEISSLAGAVSSLSLTFAGLITVVLFSFLIA